VVGQEIREIREIRGDPGDPGEIRDRDHNSELHLLSTTLAPATVSGPFPKDEFLYPATIARSWSAAAITFPQFRDVLLVAS
jgi:hypothetical protein